MKHLYTSSETGKIGNVLLIGGAFAAIFLLLIAGVLYLTGREKAKTQETEAVKPALTVTVVSGPPRVTDVLFHTALRKKFFQQAFLTVKTLAKGSEEEALKAVDAGEAGIALVEVAPLLTEPHYRIVAPISSLLLWGVTKNPAVPEARDLASLKDFVLLNGAPSGIYQKLLDGLAKQAGVMVHHQQTDAAKFFRNQEPPEVLLATEPEIAQGMKFGARVCFRLGEALGLDAGARPLVRALVVKEAYLKQEEGREAIARLRSALTQASHFIYTNPGVVYQEVLLFSFPQYDAEVQTDALKRLLTEKAIPQSMEIDGASLLRLAEVLLTDNGQAKQAVERIVLKEENKTTEN